MERAPVTAIDAPIKPPGVITQEFRTPAAVRRGVIAGFVGAALYVWVAAVRAVPRVQARKAAWRQAWRTRERKRA